MLYTHYVWKVETGSSGVQNKIGSYPPPYLIEILGNNIKIAKNQKGGVYKILVTLSSNYKIVYIGVNASFQKDKGAAQRYFAMEIEYNTCKCLNSLNRVVGLTLKILEL